mgnify:CR=1 FL=1
MDQIFDDVKRIEEFGEQTIEYDDDLPGGGQFYCVATGKHFADQKGLDDHKKSRAYKRRIKELKEEKKYSQQDAEVAAGMSVEILPKMADVRKAAADSEANGRTAMEA